MQIMWRPHNAFMKEHSFKRKLDKEDQQNNTSAHKKRVVQYTRSVSGRQSGGDPLRIVTGRLRLSVRAT